MKRLAIIGAGDLGQLIAHHVPDCGDYSVVGFYDDWAKHGARISGFPVLGNLRAVVPAFLAGVYDVLMVGIGYNHMAFRKSVFEQHQNLIPFAKLIHKSSFIDHSASVGEGCFILPGCTLDAHVVLETNVLLNTGVVVAHDTIIGSHTFLAPAVAIAGKTQVGESCFLGIHSTVVDNLTICSGTRLAAGSVVTKSITIPGLYAGVPAAFKRSI